MHYLSVSPSSQKSVSRTRTVCFVTFTSASRPYLSIIRDNGGIFIVDYRLTLLKNSILLNLTVTKSGRYYYLSLSFFFFSSNEEGSSECLNNYLGLSTQSWEGVVPRPEGMIADMSSLTRQR